MAAQTRTDCLTHPARRAGGQVDSLPELAEVALAELAARLGIRLPRRCPPVGTNRYGEPRAVQ